MRRSKKKQPARKVRVTTDDSPDKEKLVNLQHLHSGGESASGNSPEPGSPGFSSPAMDPATPSARGRGRPKGSRTSKAAEPPPVIPRKIAGAIIRAPYALMAKFRGPDWALSDEEVEAMIDPHLALAQQYLPEIVKQNPALTSVLMLHSLSIVARLNFNKPERPEENSASTLVTPADTRIQGFEVVSENPPPEKGAPVVRSPDLPGETRVGKIFPDESRSARIPPSRGL